MYIVLVKYRQFADSSHAMLDGEWVKQSKVVEVEKLTDVNEKFSNVYDVDILERSSSKAEERIKELEDAIQTTLNGFEWDMENKIETIDKSDFENYDNLKKVLNKE